jgi:hypothetical protein
VQLNLAQQDVYFLRSAAQDRAKKELVDRLKKEKTKFSNLQEEASQRGIGDLFDGTRKALSKVLGPASLVAGTLAYITSDSRRRPLLKLAPAESDESIGLKFELYPRRIGDEISTLSTNERLRFVVELDKAIEPLATASWSGRTTGHFKRLADAKRIASILNEERSRIQQRIFEQEIAAAGDIDDEEFLQRRPELGW